MVKRERVRRGKKRVCNFCVEKTDYVDYKNISYLRKYITERGKILPRRVSGNCARHQRVLTIAIKRARVMALIPFTSE
ncbi:MAG: 30S ribosomal protein S18 [Peptococcaceae bacterium]